MQINPANMALLTQGFSAIFQGAYDAIEPMWKEIAMEVPSTTTENDYAWLGQTTKFREWLGDRQFQALKAHGYKIRNRTFENSVEVGRDPIEDDQYGVFKPFFQQLGQDAKLHPDELVFSLLLAGFSTPCFDGQYFFDTDHPVGIGTQVSSVSNFQGGTGRPWFLFDTSKMIKPIILQKRRDYRFVSLDNPEDPNVFLKNQFQYGADARLNVGFGMWQFAFGSKQPLDATAYEDARAQMRLFKGDNGKPLNVKPNVVMVAPQDEGVGKQLLQAQRDAAGSDNVWANTAKLVVNPWLG